MEPAGYLILIVVVALPIAWLVSEFRGGRRLRITLGVMSLMASFGVAATVGMVQMFSANAWFGSASHRLVDTTIDRLEAGDDERVLEALRWLRSNYYPTYENRARYDELVETTVELMAPGRYTIEEIRGKGALPQIRYTESGIVIEGTGAPGSEPTIQSGASE